jgi:outer membrane protein OmpA-like peptidoglycan-associated protein
MTKLRLILLATTTLTAAQLMAAPSHAQTAPLVVAQAREELGPDGKPKQKEVPKELPKGPVTPKPPTQPSAPTVQPPHVEPKTAPPQQQQQEQQQQRQQQERQQRQQQEQQQQRQQQEQQQQRQRQEQQQQRQQQEQQLQRQQQEQQLQRQQQQKGTETHKPATEVQKPATEIQKPATEVQKPATEIQKPATGVQKPATETQKPATEVQKPATEAQKPATEVQKPATETQKPATEVQKPATGTGGASVANPPPPTNKEPIPQPQQTQALKPRAPGAVAPGPRRMEDFRGARQESDQGGRKVFTEPGRVIVVDPGGQSFIRHNEEDRFRYGARDIRTEQVGGDTRTIVIRPDGSQIITVSGRDGQMLRRIRRDREGREIIIIDNTYRDPAAVGGFYIDLPPPVIRIPYNRYIVEADDASPDVIYETMEAPPVDRIQRRYSLDEIRYSPSVRQLMPSIDLTSINFETGSWEIPADQAAKLQVIADGLNRAIQRNPREVFLIEGHTDAVGNDVDNLSLSDRRAESAANLLTQQFQVPAENLTSQGYGRQYLKEQTDGPSRINRRVTVRRITPLLNGGTASLPPPPPGTAPPR